MTDNFFTSQSMSALEIYAFSVLRTVVLVSRLPVVESADAAEAEQPQIAFAQLSSQSCEWLFRAVRSQTQLQSTRVTVDQAEFVRRISCARFLAENHPDWAAEPRSTYTGAATIHSDQNPVSTAAVCGARTEAAGPLLLAGTLLKGHGAGLDLVTNELNQGAAIPLREEHLSTIIEESLRWARTVVGVRDQVAGLFSDGQSKV